MTVDQIQKKHDKEARSLAIKHEVAKEIREMLDSAKRELNKLNGNADYYDDEDVETSILEMVTE